jgi:replication factor C large subunit
MTWVEQYRAKTFDEIKGQDAALIKIKSFLEEYSKTKSKKAIILHGPPGTGKTTLAYVMANHLNSEIFELNASDLRNKDSLEETLKPAIEQKSLFKKGKLILVDEVDGLSASDRGGLPLLLDMVKRARIPIVITANDIWDKKFITLRQTCEIAQLKEVSYKIIKDILISILRKEGKFIENEALTSISIKSKGDVRAAINDAQMMATDGRLPLIQSEISERDKEKDIFNVLRYIFKNHPKEDMLELFDKVDMSIDDIALWIEENIPKEYKNEVLARAYERLSKADIFKNRIYRHQHWRFLIYENILLSYGIAAAKSQSQEISTSFISYTKPSRILKIWLNNQKIAKRKTITEKYASIVHTSQKSALQNFPIISSFMNNPNVVRELRLSEEENAYLENYLRK